LEHDDERKDVAKDVGCCKVAQMHLAGLYLQAGFILKTNKNFALGVPYIEDDKYKNVAPPELDYVMHGQSTRMSPRWGFNTTHMY
jgi:hypothetical protein